MKNLFAVLVVSAIALVSVGCGGESTVHGKVTFNGAPLDNGEVMFHPGAQGALAIGSITKGSYELSTGQSDKVAQGTYKVTIVANEKVTEAPAVNPANPTMEYVPKRLTPDVYADEKTTPLTAEVKPGSNTFNFDLKSP
jgi:hypothetical protein